MLSIQQKSFDESKKAGPYPRDFARWNALDYFRRRRGLNSVRFYVTSATTVAVALLCLASAFATPWRHVHQANPVSKAHAMFNQNCANCHSEMFQPVLRLFGCTDAASVTDATCNACHHGAPPPGSTKHETNCVTCHREHQGHELLAGQVADRHLTAYLTFGDKDRLPITSFNRDHPEFQPSVVGKKDEAKIRFSHKAHLDLDVQSLREANEKAGRFELRGLGDKMKCDDCHKLDDQRHYLLPIKYEDHCSRCHHLNVTLKGDFAPALVKAAAQYSKTPLPHQAPAVVRAVLQDRLVQFAQANQVAADQAKPDLKRPLPWAKERDAQWSWASRQAKAEEGLLFLRFAEKQWNADGKAPPPALTSCSHCHIETGREADGLPIFAETKIPARWYHKSEFNHGSHRMMGCTECHDRNAAGVTVAESKSAADILLPTIRSCTECHRPSGGASNACAECHRYHDRKQEPGLQGKFTLDEMARKSR